MSTGIQYNILSFETLGLGEEYKPFFVPCVRWLEDEGIIRTSSISAYTDGNGAIGTPVISALGFRLLGTDFVLGDKNEKLGNAVKEVSTTDRSYSQFGDFFGGLLGGFTKSMGS